jgi:mannose-6-phosphate isomerase-like protein (cupin superfamily)
MILLEGTTTVTLGNGAMQLWSGDAVIVPANVLHQVQNAGNTQAQWLLALPIGTRFFRPDGEEVHPAFVT